MKKTAVILFPAFCNYEIATLLGLLKMMDKPVEYIGANKEIYRCEEGIQTIADKVYDECNFEEFDSLIITGSFAEGIHYLFKDEKLHEIIRDFNNKNKLIGAISSGPMTLCKAGIMDNKKFIAGVERKWFLEDDNIKLSKEDMRNLIDLNDITIMEEEPKFLFDKNILTAIGRNYIDWSKEFIRILKLKNK